MIYGQKRKNESKDSFPALTTTLLIRVLVVHNGRIILLLYHTKATPKIKHSCPLFFTNENPDTYCHTFSLNYAVYIFALIFFLKGANFAL